MIHIGKRAMAYIDEHSIDVGRHGERRLLVADCGAPQGVSRTLTRVFGRPQTIDRGEVAYWSIDAGSEQIGI